MQFTRDRLESDSGIVSIAGSTISTNLTSLTDPIGPADVEGLGVSPLGVGPLGDTNGLLAEPLNPVSSSTLRNQTLSTTATSETLQKTAQTNGPTGAKENGEMDFQKEKIPSVQPKNSVDSMHDKYDSISKMEVGVKSNNVNNAGVASGCDKPSVPSVDSLQPAEQRGNMKTP